MRPRSALLLLALPVIGCGDRSDLLDVTATIARDASVQPLPDAHSLPRDAGVDRFVLQEASTLPSEDASKSSPPSSDAGTGTCSLQLYGPENPIIIHGTMALAEVAGTEIPFIFFQCEGTANGTAYTFAAQYEPGANVLQAGFLTIGTGASVSSTTECMAKVQLDGGFTTPGESYGVGEPFAAGFTGCQFPRAGGPAINVSGQLSAPLTPK